MSVTRQVEIDSPESIVEIFAALAREGQEATLSFENEIMPCPVKIDGIDVVERQCVLSMRRLDDIEQHFRSSRPFRIHARLDSAMLETAIMQAHAVQRHEHRLRIHCVLPDRLSQRRAREDFRAALATDVNVRVELRAEDGNVCCGDLVDISVGGCLVRLPQQERSHRRLDPGSHHDLRVIFPNAEYFDVRSHATHLEADAGMETLHCGLTFEYDTPEYRQVVWGYVCEIDREFARRSALRSELRPLAASLLFLPGGDAVPVD